MIAPSRIRCRVIAIPVSSDMGVRSTSPRPSELLPWADPYIAGLIHKLQAEVRSERREAATWDEDAETSPGEFDEFGLTAYEFEPYELPSDCFAEAEWPWYDDQFDFDPADDDYTPDFDDRRGDIPAV
jgi:hypothetical protein